MVRSTRRLALAIALAIPAGLSAQTTVASTYGAGNAYNPNWWWFVHGDQSIAQGFAYGGADAFLSSLNISLNENANPYQVTFGVGGSMNSVTQLESWTVYSNGSISNLVSALMPALSAGNTYWVWATSSTQDYYSGWNINNQGIYGLSYTFTDGVWSNCAECESGAYSVQSVTTTPEPASMILMGTGMFSAVMARRRRKKASAA